MRNLHLMNLSALIALTSTGKRRMEADPKTNDKPTDSGGSGKREMTAEQWEAQRRAELDKENSKDLLNRVIKLESDNYDLRRKAAPEGGLVLTADERKRWEAWEALGKPDEVKTSIEQGKKDRAFVEKAEKAESLGKVASAAGWDAEAFTSLNDMTPGLEWRVQEVKKGEETIQQAQVKVGDDWKNAEDFAGERWKKFLPVLEAESTKSNSGGDDQDDESPARRVPTGGAGGGRGRAYSVEEAERQLEESGDYSM